jgi:hypothetical protein
VAAVQPWRGRGEAKLELPAADARVERRRQRRRGVDDEHVTRREVLGQVAEAGVDEVPVVARGDEHRDVVAAEAARLRRLSCFEPLGQLEPRAPLAGGGSRRAKPGSAAA